MIAVQCPIKRSCTEWRKPEGMHPQGLTWLSHLEKAVITPTPKAQSLGVLIDGDLSFSSHITLVISRKFAGTFFIASGEFVLSSQSRPLSHLSGHDWPSVTCSGLVFL